MFSSHFLDNLVSIVDVPAESLSLVSSDDTNHTLRFFDPVRTVSPQPSIILWTTTYLNLRPDPSVHHGPQVIGRPADRSLSRTTAVYYVVSMNERNQSCLYYVEVPGYCMVLWCVVFIHSHLRGRSGSVGVQGRVERQGIAPPTTSTLDVGYVHRLYGRLMKPLTVFCRRHVPIRNRWEKIGSTWTTAPPSTPSKPSVSRSRSLISDLPRPK